MSAFQIGFQATLGYFLATIIGAVVVCTVVVVIAGIGWLLSKASKGKLQ